MMRLSDRKVRRGLPETLDNDVWARDSKTSGEVREEERQKVKGGQDREQGR